MFPMTPPRRQAGPVGRYGPRRRPGGRPRRWSRPSIRRAGRIRSIRPVSRRRADDGTPAPRPGQHRRLHRDPAPRPVRRAGLASRGPPAAAADRGAGPQAGRVRLRRSAIAPTGRAGRRTPTSPACRPPTSSSRWPTTRAARAPRPLPERAPQKNMIALSKAITDEEVQAAAAYFAALKPRHNVRVVETADVPKTVVGGWFLADRQDRRHASRSASASSRCPRASSSSRTATRARASSPTCPPGSIARGRALAAGVPGKTDRLRHLPRSRPEGPRRHPADRRPVAELRGAAALRIPDRRAQRRGAAADEAGRRRTSRIDDMIALAAYWPSQAP